MALCDFRSHLDSHCKAQDENNKATHQKDIKLKESTRARPIKTLVAAQSLPHNLCE